MAGVAAAVVIVAGVLIATRDAWIAGLKAHRNLVRPTTANAIEASPFG
jgi:hypothetical protein